MEQIKKISINDTEYQIIDETALHEDDMPTTLPNPYALTFTGTVTSTYDGSEAMTIDIPAVAGLDAHNVDSSAHADIREEISQLSSEKVDKTNISLGIASDGLIYIFVNGSPVGTGIPQSTSGDVFGYVDENNTIVLTGNLADGTYTIKYEIEDEDGEITTVDIGDLVLDTNTYYSVTNNLTNCTSNSSDIQAIEGNSYSATISANSGYEISSIVVTMGGEDITASAVSGGNISITNVTGNIVITAVAEEVVIEITNQIPISTDASGNLFVGTNGEQGYKTGTRLSLSSGGETTSNATDYECTGFIPATQTDVISIENIDITEENSTNIICYDINKQPIKVNDSYYGTSLYNLFVPHGIKRGNAYLSVLNRPAFLTFPTDVAFIRIGSKSITADSVITVQSETDVYMYTNLLPLSTTINDEGFVGTHENGGDGYEYGYRIKSSTGEQTAQDGVYCSGFIPATLNDVIRIKGITEASTDTHNAIAFYDSEKTYLCGYYILEGAGGVTIDGDLYTIIPSESTIKQFAFFRFSCGSITDDTIVTVNQEIV